MLSAFVISTILHYTSPWLTYPLPLHIQLPTYTHNYLPTHYTTYTLLYLHITLVSVVCSTLYFTMAYLPTTPTHATPYIHTQPPTYTHNYLPTYTTPYLHTTLPTHHPS